jgi:hypothetical protein
MLSGLRESFAKNTDKEKTQFTEDKFKSLFVGAEHAKLLRKAVLFSARGQKVAKFLPWAVNHLDLPQQAVFLAVVRYGNTFKKF